MHGSKPDSRVARFWDYESGDWGQKYGKATSYFYRCRTFHKFFRAAGLERASILDYGCGSGDITFPMLQSGHTVTGVDIAEGMVRKATDRAKQFGLSARASYHHLDDDVLCRISSKKFDAVVCSSVLEYVEDDRSLLRMFHDVLRDGGILLVSGGGDDWVRVEGEEAQYDLVAAGSDHGKVLEYTGYRDARHHDVQKRRPRYMNDGNRYHFLGRAIRHIVCLRRLPSHSLAPVAIRGPS